MVTEILMPGSSNPFWVLELLNYGSELTPLSFLFCPFQPARAEEMLQGLVVCHLQYQRQPRDLLPSSHLQIHFKP